MRPRVRAACLSLWILFLWLFPVVLSATSTKEEGHACCRRSKHSCCKKAGKGSEISGRSCGMSCPAMEKFPSGPAPAMPAPAVHLAVRVQPSPVTIAEAPAKPVRTSTPKQFQRPPPSA
ncbi:MAG: hypothetical protein JNL62_14905 [Bryobacterales bacterium]|nr:hypothetical protein [Bryobacterales bacterium]